MIRAHRAGHVVGRARLEGWCDSILTFPFPSASCPTSRGISKHFISLQTQGFPPQVPSSSPCFLFHNPRKPEQARDTPAFLPLPPPPPLATLSCLLPQIFRSWVRLGSGPGCGGQNSGWQPACAQPFLGPSQEVILDAVDSSALTPHLETSGSFSDLGRGQWALEEATFCWSQANLEE